MDDKRILSRPCSASSFFGSNSVAERIDDQRKGRGGLAPARVIEMVAGEWRAPIGQDTDELSLPNVGSHLILEEIRQTKPRQGRV